MAITHLREKPATSDEVNKEQRRYWTNEGQQQYQQHGDRFDDIASAFGHAMLDAAELRPGHRVLDVGCGYATTTIEAARRVTSSGRVLGVDLSAAMLQTARRRVAATGLNHLPLLQADAQVHTFGPGSFDAVISPVRHHLRRPRCRLRQPRTRTTPRWPAGVRLLAGPPQERMGRHGARRGSPAAGAPTRTRHTRRSRLFADAPEDTVAAPVAAMCAAFSPHAGAGGVVLSGVGLACLRSPLIPEGTMSSRRAS